MVRVLATREVGPVTGAMTRRFGIHATDLGILWDNGQGRLLVAFGDTYGTGWGGFGAGPPKGSDWRCNALAFSGNRDLDTGLRLDSVVARADGTAAQILERDRQADENTVIPNSGIAVSGYNYLHYMSVRKWGPAGKWDTNYAGIAVSTDGGDTWTKPPGARWPNSPKGDHPFQICCFAADRSHVYLMGTTNGRFGPAHLGRCGRFDVLVPGGYEYWAAGKWVRDPYEATPVIGGPVGELSIEYNDHFKQWIALHLDEDRAAIVLKWAEDLTGPWSEGQVVVDAKDYPAPYGGYLHPWANDGTEIYFTLSQWGPYNIKLMRTQLT
jgi:D-arabinan endo alpha-(1,5)-arabinofuranosidase